MGISLQTNDIIQVIQCGYFRGQLSMNNLYYRVDSSSFPGILLDDLPDAFMTYCTGFYDALMGSYAQYVGVMSKIVFPIGRITNVYKSTLAAVDGGGGDTPLPTGACGLIRFRRERPGRQARGRNYLPFPADTELDGTTGEPSAGYLTKVGNYTAHVCFTPTVPVKSHNLVLEQQIHGRLTGTNPVVEVVISQGWATQRRRSDFGKTNANPFA